MCSDLAMEAKDLRKVYHLYPNPMSRLKQIAAGDRRKYYEEFVALQGLSFELRKGEVLGVIGRNGAGKSTLLQLICGTLSPTSGSLEVSGRIAALLELGAGFNPEFSGRENIYFSGSVMGLSRTEIDELLEEIIDFSGIRPFIDQPVKTYSSGMYVRLAFSVATSVDPDILIIDEALSVGDGDFARRSFDRIMAMRDAGKTILFCSHALYQVETLCSRAIWLEAGAVVESGSPDEVVANYQSFLDRMSLIAESVGDKGSSAVEAKPASVDGAERDVGATSTRILSTRVSADGNVGQTLTVKSGETSVVVEVEFVSHVEGEIPGVAIVIHAASGQLVSSCGSWDDGVYPKIDTNGIGSIKVEFNDLPLLKGRYAVGVLLFCERGVFLHDEADPVATLEVNQSGVVRGIVNLPHQWSQSAVLSSPQAEIKPVKPTEPPASIGMQTPQSSKARWRAEDARDVNESELLDLFAESFGHDVSPAVWRWKYRFTPNPGTVVYDGDRAVAFNGGMPRKARVLGVEEQVVQMGDVMVAPDIRGILTRRGPFYLSVHKYFSERVGPEHEFSLAFGFPNARHARLGVKQKLYCEVDKIVQARWGAIAGRSWTLSARALTESDLPLVDTLWSEMMQTAERLAIGVRDGDWIRHRYMEKPSSHYKVMLVFGRLTRKPKGVVVLKDHGKDGVELIDMVAAKKDFNALVHVARIMTRRLEREWLFGWFTPSALDWCRETIPIVEETDVVIPGSAVNDVESALRVKGCWWLMGGDTDFR